VDKEQSTCRLAKKLAELKFNKSLRQVYFLTFLIVTCRMQVKDNNLNFEKLVAYASKYYRKETLLRVGEIVAGELL
jgi:hypothetical protein